MCGENDYVDLTGAQKLGSTPHVRGKPDLILPEAFAVGLNPTCAGKTLPDKVLRLQDARKSFTFPVG